MKDLNYVFKGKKMATTKLYGLKQEDNPVQPLILRMGKIWPRRTFGLVRLPQQVSDIVHLRVVEPDASALDFAKHPHISASVPQLRGQFASHPHSQGQQCGPRLD